MELKSLKYCYAASLEGRIMRCTPPSIHPFVPCLRFLADRTNGRAIGTVLCLSVCMSVCLSVTLCIVAKRCVLEQMLLLTAYRKSYMKNRLVPK